MNFLKFLSLLLPPFFYSCVFNQRKSKKNNDDSKKENSKLPYVRPWGVPDSFSFLLFSSKLGLSQ